MRRILITALPFVLAALSACGQTGPLHLPAGTAAPAVPAVPAPLPPGAQTIPTGNASDKEKDKTVR